MRKEQIQKKNTEVSEKIFQVTAERPRLAVFKSAKHILRSDD
jgi:ribosomal protein L18